MDLVFFLEVINQYSVSRVSPFVSFVLLLALVWLLIVIPGYVVYQSSIQRKATKD